MSVWQMDNYSFYGTAGKTYVGNMLNGIYAALEQGSLNDYLLLSTDPDGLSSGYVLSHLVITGNNPASARVPHPLGAQTTMGMARRVWFNKLPADDNFEAQPIQFLDNGSAILCGVSVSSTGRLYMYATGGNSYTTTAPKITANGWYHIEFLCDQTNMELRVEGVPVLGPSPHGLTTPGYAQHRSRTAFGNETGTGNENLIMYLKDTFAYDGNGTYNNTFVGSVILYAKQTTSDVSLNWTPSTGTVGWSILDNVPPNDTIFISAPTPPPSPYVGGLGPALPPDVTSVKGVQTIVRAAKSDGGDATLQNGVISGASTGLGTDRPITVAQTYWWDIFETDPATSSPWLPAAVDAMELQIDRTT